MSGRGEGARNCGEQPVAGGVACAIWATAESERKRVSAGHRDINSASEEKLCEVN